MKYIIITTPFSGATHFGTVFLNLLQQWYNCRGFVRYVESNEHVYTQVVRTVDIEYNEGTIEIKNKKYYYKYPKPEDSTVTVPYIIASPNHLIRYYSLFDKGEENKINQIKSFIDEFEYKVIYLERRDKLHQIIAECHKSETDPSKIPVIRSSMANGFINILENYKQTKSVIPGTIVYYEDFINLGQNEEAIIKLLDLEKKDYIPKAFEFNPVFLTEKDSISPPSWKEDREEILSRLLKIG